MEHTIIGVVLWVVGEVGCVIYSFICLSAGAIEWQPCCFDTILLLYAPPKVISVLVLFITFGGSFQFISIQVGLHRLLLPLQRSFLQSSLLSALFFCNMLSANDLEVVDCGMRILSYYFRYCFRSLRITVVMDRNRMYLNQE